MMYYTTKPQEMRMTERNWMEETGAPGLLLMEQAAQGVVTAIRRYSDHGRVLFLCGPGNNGGDGYAAARIWALEGGKSIIWELTDEHTGDAEINRNLCMMCDLNIEIVTLSKQPIPSPLPNFDAVVDALFGTGLSRKLEGVAADLVYRFHWSSMPIIAVDIPSGLNGLTGMPMGDNAIRATETVTFHRIKQGLVLGQSADYVGKLTVHPIMIYDECDCSSNALHIMVPGEHSLIAPRHPNAHKGEFGKAVIFAGSMGMTGAAALCARAAIKSGAGLTYILARASIVPMLQVLVPGAVCVPLPENDDGSLTAECAAIVKEKLSGANAAAVGCGLGHTDDLLPILRLFRQADCPVVWDADALNLLAAHRELLPLPYHHFITPHPGEAARLLGCTAKDVTENGLAALDQLHTVCGCNVLLKGARTLMTDGRDTGVNIIGTPAMAKGGSGDILTGILTALAAVSSKHSALHSDLKTMQRAALAHGMAGLRAERQVGQHGVLPEQLCDCIRFDTEGLN